MTLESEVSERDWQFRQLKWSLQSLARAGSVQRPLFPEAAAGAADLAFGFDHWASVVSDAHGGELSPLQVAALAAIAAKIATMSRDGTEFDADLWTDAALRTSEHWADVRRLAQSALDAFEWAPADVPEERE
jgi:hypothetical protein